MNQVVKRNHDRLPHDFMFQLTSEESQAHPNAVTSCDRSETQLSFLFSLYVDPHWESLVDSDRKVYCKNSLQEIHRTVSPQSEGVKLMPQTQLTLEAEAQLVLDELWKEKQIPFKLSVGKITKASGQYTIHFYDSRIHSARVPLTRDHSFRDLVRSAVLQRVEKMSGPLKNSPKQKT